MEYTLLTNSPVFQGFTADEIKVILETSGAFTKTFDRNEAIYHAGEKIECLGIVAEGQVQIEKNDFWGNKSILDSLGPGNVFAETYAMAKIEASMVDVIATEKSRIMFLNVQKAFLMEKSVSADVKDFYLRLTINLLKICSKKNLVLSRRISHTSSKSIRGRLLSYLSYSSAAAGSGEFEIPFNRQQLADYLNVDRSAMCAELSKMQTDGLLEYHKNTFRLKNKNIY